MLLFRERFDGVAGQPVAGFTALAGSPLMYVEGGGAVAQDGQPALLRYDQWCGTADARVRTAVRFGSPATTDRSLSVCLLLDGANFYEARLRTNFNSRPAVSIRKTVAGVETTILAETEIPVLAAGIPVTLELYRLGSTLRVLVDGTQYGADCADADLTGNWRPGYRFENYTSGSWVVDDLEVFDHTDEPSPEGWVLQVGAATFDEAARAAAGIELQAMERSYLGPATLTFVEHCAHTAASFHPEQEVRLLAPGSPRPVDFRGLVKRVSRLASGQEESVVYTCYDPRLMAKSVVPEHPTTKAFSIVWNAPKDDEDHDAAFAEKTVGQILKWYFDTFAEDLREAKAAPNGAMYVASDFTALTVKPTKLNLRGDFEQVLSTLLAFQPTSAALVDPSDGKWRFVDWTGHPAKDLSFTTFVAPENAIDDDSTQCYTAVAVRSIRREKVPFHLSSADGGLVPAWDRDLEKHWSPARGRRSSLPGTVKTVVAPDTLEIALSWAKDEVFTDEWKGTTFRLTSGAGLGGAYTIASNTASVDGTYTVVLTDLTWPVPAAGDSCEVTDDARYATTKDRNGFRKVFTHYQIADLDKREVFKKDCTTGLFVKPTSFGSLERMRVPLKIEFAASPGVVATSLPIVLSGSETKGGGCNSAGDYESADFELTGEHWKTTVLERRWPPAGWHGTAYSTDPARWDGGGPPHPDDWGVRREKVIEDPYYLAESQNEAMDDLLQSWLLAHCDKPFAGRHVYRAGDADGIDRDFVALQRAVTFSSLRRTTGLESGVYIFAHTVTFDFAGDRTILDLGNLASFGSFEYEQLRDAAIANSRLGDVQRLLRELQEREECRRDAPVKLTGADPGPVCGDSVRTKVRERSTSVTTIIREIEERIRILEKNKADTEEQDVTPPDSGLLPPPDTGPGPPADTPRTTLRDAAGTLWGIDADGNFRVAAASGGAPVPGPEGNLQLGAVGTPVAGGMVHKHVEAYETETWETGTARQWVLPFTPALTDPPLVFLRRGPVGDPAYQVRGVDYAIEGNVVTFLRENPPPGSATKIHAEVGCHRASRACRVRVDLERAVGASRAALVDIG